MIKYLYKVSKHSPHPYFFSNLIHKPQHSKPSQLTEPSSVRQKPGVILSQTPLSTFSELTASDKKQLKLFIPSSPFNPRLPMIKQKQYLPIITSQLYQLQKSLFPPQIRILESLTDSNLNKYLNLIYKDIYARFLVSKGIGINWEGRYSGLGVMNSNEEIVRLSPYHLFVRALESGKLFVKKVPTLVSLKSFQEHDPDSCNMEVIKRMGHYVLFPIISFGKYRDQFDVIKSKGGRIELLCLVSELWKSTQISAVMMVNKLKYIILRKEGTDQYIVTSFDHFQTNKTYFTKHKYSKHSMVDSIHFQGMQAENLFNKKIPILMEETKRGKGSEISGLCPVHTLGDNEIAADLGVEITSTVTEEGIFKLGEKEEVSLGDEGIEETMREYLRKKERLMQDLNDVVDDTIILAEDKEVLYLVPTEKLYLRVTDKERGDLISDLKSNTSIQESKVTLPEPNPNHPMRGKWRRRFQKKLGKVREQETDYYTLEESLKLDQICISTPNNKTYPVMVNLKKNKAFASENNIRRMREMINRNQTDLDSFQELKQSFSQQKTFFLNENFVKAAQILNIEEENSDLKNIAIEPQSSTEGFLQYYLHVIASLNLPFKMSMIKLHPTLKETIQNVSMETLIMGAAKSSDMREYGWGYEAVRVWVAKMDSHKGDREMIETSVNEEMPHCTSIRKTLWKILAILNKVSPDRLKQIRESTPKLPWFDQFMLDHIDFYILNMEKAYKKLDLSTAYELTLEFFRQYIQEIYVKPVRKSLISYYSEDSKLLVLERLLSLVGVISPILPFTAYHVSQLQLHQWPTVSSPAYQKIANYNKMIMLRTRLKNKLSLNRMSNCTVFIGGMDKNQISQDQMTLFLDVNQVVYDDLNLNERFRMKEGEYLISVYPYESCYRCDQRSGNQKYLCKKCEQYLGK